MSSFSHPICFRGEVSKLRKTWWRIREAIDDFLCKHNIYFHWKISNAYYYIKHRILQSHLIDTKLEKGHWIDVTSKMEASLLEMVDGFVSKDGEDAFSVVYWDDDDGHSEAKAKMIEILYWKHVRQPWLEAEKDALWDSYHEKYPMVFKNISEEECKEKNLSFDKGFTKITYEGVEDEITENFRKGDFELIMFRERFIESETQRILHLCVDVRNYLWT